MSEIERLSNWPAVLEIIESDAGQKNQKWYAKKIAKLLNLSCIGSGAHRAVLDYTGKALKIALSKRGVQENYRESKLFFSLPGEEKIYFATCLGVGYGWALYEKLVPMSYQVGYREYRVKMGEIRKKLVRLRITDISSPRNWGIREGRGPVILDYSLYLSNLYGANERFD